MSMKITSRQAPVTVLFALMVIFGLPIVSYAQGRGNGRGAGSNIDKKCAKFVNCHDARDGRVDGRGPAINQGSTIPVWQPQPPVVTYPNRRVRDRDRDQDNQVYYPRSRNRRTHRDTDTDVNPNETRRRRHRDRSDDAETRDRRTRRRDRSNVID
jgi:hypothetical protein